MPADLLFENYSQVSSSRPTNSKTLFMSR